MLVVHHSGKDERKARAVPVHFVLRWMLNTGYAGRTQEAKRWLSHAPK
ncbi:hypothetical protein EC12264_1349 [Escherichia coli 1.2264]|nr:hypothetical protein EC12264_1349 [Escherichia coli 1.2264]